MEMFERNKEKIIYTLKHRLAFFKCVDAYCKEEDKPELYRRAMFHDMDKVVLNCLCDEEFASKLHNRFTGHHKKQPGADVSLYDYIEMAIDWECARYTKPDKPLNAYLTMVSFYPQLEDNILPILKEMGIDRPENNDREDIINEIKDYNVDSNVIKSEIENYINNFENSCDKYEVIQEAIKVYKKLESKSVKSR
jgi:hypothetical protein